MATSQHTRRVTTTWIQRSSAAAIAARLALGDALVEATRHAKHYVTEAIRHAPGLGRGHGPLGHFFSR